MKNIFFTIAFLWGGLWVMAQSQQQPVMLPITSKEGLPSDNVYATFQDSKGLIWFATERGLVRYDGKKLKVYTQADGLTDREVLGLAEDKKGKIWVTCFNRFSVIKEGEKFASLEQHPQLAEMFKLPSSIGINHILDIGTGIWFANRSQIIYFYNGSTLKTITLPGHPIYKFEQVDSIVYAYSIRCIYRIYPDFRFEIAYQLPRFMGRELVLFDLALSNGINLVSYTNDTTVLIKRNGHQFSMGNHMLDKSGTVYIDQKKRFWVCSRQKGLFCYRLDAQENFVLERIMLPDIRVNTIFQDREGVFWLSTKGNGVYVFRDDFAVYDKAFYNTNNYNSVVLNETRSGKWFGNAQGQIYRVNNGNIVLANAITQEGFSKNIRQIYTDQQGQNWVVTDDGVYVEKNKVLHRIPEIRSPKMLTDSKDLVYCAAGGAPFVINKTNFKIHKIIAPRFASIYMDTEGMLWAGGLDGLYNMQDTFKNNLSNPFPELQSRIISIQEDANGHLWVVTSNFGVVKIIKKNGQIIATHLIKDKDGSSFNDVLPNIIFQKDKILFATSKAIYQAFNDGRLLKINMKTELSTSEITSIIEADEHSVWVGTSRGVLLKNIGANLTSDLEYPVFVSEISYRNDEKMVVVDLLSRDSSSTFIQLPASASLIEIEFSNLSNNFSQDVTYECRIVKGFANLWALTFSNLRDWLAYKFFDQQEVIDIDRSSLSLGVDPAPGLYQITTYALYPNQQKSSNAATVVFSVWPNWYEILWIQLCFIGLIVFGIYLFNQSRISLQKNKNEILNLSFQTLQSQINPHFVGNSVNAFNQFFYPPDPAKASIYINLFNSILRRTFELSNRTFSPFDEEINYIRNYMTMMKIRLGDKLLFDIVVDEKIDVNMPFPVLILQPILENATIHGINPHGQTQIEIAFSKEHGRIICTVKDNGIGLNAALQRRKQNSLNKKSVGLDIIKDKARILNALYKMEMVFTLQDMTDVQPSQNGTLATISFKQLSHEKN